jgi:hypothetical protein
MGRGVGAITEKCQFFFLIIYKIEKIKFSSLEKNFHFIISTQNASTKFFHPKLKRDSYNPFEIFSISIFFAYHAYFSRGRMCMTFNYRHYTLEENFISIKMHEEHIKMSKAFYERI